MHKKTGCFLYAVTGILFVFCFLTGRDLALTGNIVWTASYTIKILLLSLGLGGILGTLLGFGVSYSEEKQFFNRIYEKNGEKAPKEAVGFLVCMGLLFLSWLPYLLAYFPGICAYDAVTQIGQIETGEYVEHHPLAHTLWIRFCLFAGTKLFGSSNAGTALYGILQMLLLAAAISYGILVLRRFRIKKGIRVAVLLFSMVYPFHGFLSVSMTKDIIFSSFFLLQLLFLVQLLLPGDNRIKPGKTDLLFLTASVGMILFRNNGQYALLVLLAFLALAVLWGKKARKLWIRLLTEGILALVVGNLLLSGLSASVHAVQGDKREMLSMPIQQLARCMLYHGGDHILAEDDDAMTEEEKALVRDFFMEDGYVNYMPFISDPVKNRTLTSVFRYEPKRFLKVYLGLLARYPGDFVNAALAVNAGYVYPEDTTHARIYQEMYPGMEGKGYVQTQWWESVVEKTGVHKDSKLPTLYSALERFADSNGYLKLGVFKYLFVPGIWFWWLLLLFARMMLTGNYRKCFPLAILFGYFGTLILGPVVQLRYIYPVMLVLPFLTLLYGSKFEKAEGPGEENV